MQKKGGKVNGIFLQIELRFRNRAGPTLAMQSFHITHLINAEILAQSIILYFVLS